MGFTTISPVDDQVIATYPQMDPTQVNRHIFECEKARTRWAGESFAARGRVLREIAGLLREERESLAQLMTREMGKIVGESRAEVDKCAWVCDYYAENAEAFLAPIPVATEASESLISFQPLGVVLAVMPWNYPLWQVFRFAAPALMAGNGVVLKHAPNVFGTAFQIEALLQKSALPENLFRNLAVDTDAVADIIRNPRVRAVTLTGSVRAGRAVAGIAGQALKKTVLELGGSDAYVILKDADLAAAALACVTSRMINGGQSCIAAKRFVVEKAVLQPFTELVVAGMQAYRMGDPTDPDSSLGPLARMDLRETLHHQVKRSLAKGAIALLGGDLPDGPGAYYPPTVLSNVGPGMPAYEEELFGPVASLIAAENEADALRIANDSVFGLGGAIFTADAQRGQHLAETHLQAGCCFVNDFVRSDPRVPFGGIKDSGYGRELGLFGIREFVNIKTVWVK